MTWLFLVKGFILFAIANPIKKQTKPIESISNVWLLISKKP